MYSSENVDAHTQLLTFNQLIRKCQVSLEMPKGISDVPTGLVDTTQDPLWTSDLLKQELEVRQRPLGDFYWH